MKDAGLEILLVCSCRTSLRSQIDLTFDLRTSYLAAMLCASLVYHNGKTHRFTCYSAAATEALEYLKTNSSNIRKANPSYPSFEVAW